MNYLEAVKAPLPATLPESPGFRGESKELRVKIGQETPATIAADGYRRANGHPLTNFELRDRSLGLRDEAAFLAGDDGQIVYSCVQCLGVCQCFQYRYLR